MGCIRIPTGPLYHILAFIQLFILVYKAAGQKGWLFLQQFSRDMLGLNETIAFIRIFWNYKQKYSLYKKRLRSKSGLPHLVWSDFTNNKNDP